MTMTVEEASEWFVAIWDPNNIVEGRTPYECAKEIIQAQRKAAISECIKLVNQNVWQTVDGNDTGKLRALEALQKLKEKQ